MSAKKKIIVTISSILGFILLLGLALLVARVYIDATSGVEVDGNSASSRNFKLTLPEGTVVDSNEDNKTDNIYATKNTNYGILRISLTQSSSNVTMLSQSGVVTYDDFVVDGVNTELKSIDYSGVVAGNSSKELIRYEVSASKINKPSEKTYTSFSATAMSKRDLTASEKSRIDKEAKEMLGSLVIK